MKYHCFINDEIIEVFLIWASLFLTSILVFWLSMKIGAILKQYKDNYQAISSIDIDNSIGFNLVYRIIFVPVIIIALSAVFSMSGAEGINERLWVIAPIVAILQIILLVIVVQRALLINIKLYVFTLIASVGSSLYVSKTIIPLGIEAFIPNRQSIGTELVMAILAFIYGVAKNIPEPASDYNKRVSRYILFQKRKLMKKFGALFAKYDKKTVSIALAIIIYENYNRPKAIRIVEKIMGAKTIDITQTRGVADDEVGIKKLLREIERAAGAAEITDELILHIAEKHNPNSDSYPNEVLKVYKTLEGKYT